MSPTDNANRKKIIYLGGEAGVGKTSTAHYLAKGFKAIVIDKDAVTSVFTEGILANSKAGSTADRESKFYIQSIKPLEYEQLEEMVSSFLEQDTFKINMIITAPFFESFSDSTWINTQRMRGELNGYDIYFLFIEHNSPFSIIDRLRLRGEERDTWKIANWPIYRAGTAKRISAVRMARQVVIINTSKEDTISTLSEKILSNIGS